MSRLAERRAFVWQGLRQYLGMFAARHLEIPQRPVDLGHLERHVLWRGVARQLVAAGRNELIV